MKKVLFGVILGIVLCSGIVYGVNLYKSEDISYEPTDTSWEVNNVNDALNSLYSNVTELENLKSIGDATSENILSGKKVVVKGNTITGSMPNIGTWTNTPTSSGKVTIPEGYHNGSGYVDTSDVYNKGVSDASSTSVQSISGVLTSYMVADDGYGYGKLTFNNNKMFKKLTITLSHKSQEYWDAYAQKYLYLDGTNVGLSARTYDISNVNTIIIEPWMNTSVSYWTNVYYTLSM